MLPSSYSVRLAVYSLRPDDIKASIQPVHDLELRNLLRHSSCGVGGPLRDIVKATMICLRDGFCRGLREPSNLFTGVES